MGSGASVASNTDFSWGIVGSVSVRTIKYSGFFDQASDSMVSHFPKSRYTDSRLSWVNKEFTLEDLKTTDIESGKVIEFPHLQARFRVTNSDEFETLIHTDDLISSIESSQGKSLKNSKKQQIIENITKKCQEFWNYTRGIWVKNRKALSKKGVKHVGLDCFEIGINKEAEKKSIVEFLDKKYEPDKIGEVSHRIKGKLIVEKNNTRPHLVFIRKSSFAEIEKNERVISEINEEILEIVYCWDETPALGSEDFMRSEIKKMNEIIKFVANEFSQKDRHRLRSQIL